MPKFTSAVVIGSGFGGLALAIRLQAAGIQTVVLEKRDAFGGRAYKWDVDGHVFDAGPTVITDPDCLRQLWGLTGSDMAQDVDLLPVLPFYRLMWSDGTIFDYSNDDAFLEEQIRALDPADVEGYARFLEFSNSVYEEGYVKLGAVPFLNFPSMIKAAPAMIKSQAWRSVYSRTKNFIRNEKLRQALSFHTLLVGGNPMSTSSIYALIHKLEKDGGVWAARGGTNALVAGMVRYFRRIGGEINSNCPVSAIEHDGDKVTGVVAGGQRYQADLVASNADIVHSYGLVEGSSYADREVDRLKAKRYSPSLFLLHFGLEGKFPHIAHHSILFSDRYGPLLDDIYRTGIIPRDPSIYLHHPSASDPTLAPDGCSTFYALAPVPHLGKTDVNWTEFAKEYETILLDRISAMLIPDVKDRVRTSFAYTPFDFRDDLNAHLGSAFSLEPTLTQSAYFRAHNRDKHFSNLFFVGAGTHPGAGIPGVVGSAKATASLII